MKYPSARLSYRGQIAAHHYSSHICSGRAFQLINITDRSFRRSCPLESPSEHARSSPRRGAYAGAKARIRADKPPEEGSGALRKGLNEEEHISS
jgi:hypothetical protein